MLAKWGSTSLPNRKLAIGFYKKPKVSKRGYRVFTKVEVPFRGVVTGTDPSNVDDEMDTLETAMGTLDQDFTLFHDDGTTPTIHAIDSSATLKGTRCTFQWLDPRDSVRGSGGEFVRWRSFAGLIEAELNDCESEIVEWGEQLYQPGTCGNQVVAQEAIAASPILVTPQAAGTSALLIQKGYAVGWSDYPAFPAYKYPLAVMARQSGGWRLDPIYGRHVTHLFPIRWHYQMALTASVINSETPTAPP